MPAVGEISPKQSKRCRRPHKIGGSLRRTPYFRKQIAQARFNNHEMAFNYSQGLKSTTLFLIYTPFTSRVLKTRGVEPLEFLWLRLRLRAKWRGSGWLRLRQFIFSIRIYTGCIFCFVYLYIFTACNVHRGIRTILFCRAAPMKRSDIRRQRSPL